MQSLSSRMKARSRLIDACETAVIEQSRMNPEDVPLELRGPLRALSAGLNQVRPGWPIRLWKAIRTGCNETAG